MPRRRTVVRLVTLLQVQADHSLGITSYMPGILHHLGLKSRTSADRSMQRTWLSGLERPLHCQRLLRDQHPAAERVRYLVRTLQAVTARGNR